MTADLPDTEEAIYGSIKQHFALSRLEPANLWWKDYGVNNHAPITPKKTVWIPLSMPAHQLELLSQAHALRLQLGEQPQSEDFPYPTLYAGYLHQVITACIFEYWLGCFCWEKGSLFAYLETLPAPTEFPRWFETHYAPSHPLRQILFAMDAYAPIRFVWGMF